MRAPASSIGRSGVAAAAEEEAGNVRHALAERRTCARGLRGARSRFEGLQGGELEQGEGIHDDNAAGRRARGALEKFADKAAGRDAERARVRAHCVRFWSDGPAYVPLAPCSQSKGNPARRARVRASFGGPGNRRARHGGGCHLRSRSSTRSGVSEGRVTVCNGVDVSLVARTPVWRLPLNKMRLQRAPDAKKERDRGRGRGGRRIIGAFSFRDAHDICPLGIKSVEPPTPDGVICASVSPKVSSARIPHHGPRFAILDLHLDAPGPDAAGAGAWGWSVAAIPARAPAKVKGRCVSGRRAHVLTALRGHRCGRTSSAIVAIGDGSSSVLRRSSRRSSGIGARALGRADVRDDERVAEVFAPVAYVYRSGHRGLPRCGDRALELAAMERIRTVADTEGLVLKAWCMASRDNPTVELLRITERAGP
ncbi:uncharacterized protein BXZ73DRAFT_78335 [Epithele typhae]|uniref:uncharacterized protein n=1 Tax=Epithele typhae TaxID=378194 RepID=UPI002008C9D2|nr:uncharacterized protein BXZ73DRAFT_78335 [Epithele typhae]KAH9928529.1 hypothetical protein BXZ73DRAFT_78335 [Epithele typhae]